MKLKLRYDSRDFNYQQTFGQVVDIPDEIDFDTPLFDDVQPNGDVKCVAYSVCDQAEDEFKKEFDIDDLWERVPSNQFGSDPRDVLKETIDNGLLPKVHETLLDKLKDGLRMKDYKTFYRADIGQKDPFTNVQMSATLANKSVIGALFWCSEWLNVPDKGVMPRGENILNGHAFTIEGWKIINGETMFIIEFWGRKKLYMPRDTFNYAMKKWGSQTWLLATAEVNSRREKTILETIKDLAINTILLLRQLIKIKEEIKPVEKPIEVKPSEVYHEVKETMKRDMITEWGLAIQEFEGFFKGSRSERNNNPFNLKFANQKKAIGKDDKNFAKFQTYKDGFEAGKTLLINACTGKSKSYKPDMTMAQFFNVYAPTSDNNNPHKYASFVCAKLKIHDQTKIKELL